MTARFRSVDRTTAYLLPPSIDEWLPEELEIREKRLAAIRDAKVKIEERAAERHARDLAEYEEKVAKREAREKATGKKARVLDIKSDRLLAGDIYQLAGFFDFSA